MKNKSIGFIISNYIAGAPVGPMLTSRLYLQEIIRSGFLGEVLCVAPKNNSKQILLSDFDFVKKIDITEVNFSLPIPLRISLSLQSIFKIYSMYRRYQYVHVFWYPGIIHVMPKSIIKRTFFTMMDSQVKLIRETSKAKNSLENLILKAKISIYSYYEKKIHENSLLVNYVSEADVPISYRGSKNVVITKLPTYNESITTSVAEVKIRPKLLIPRPDSSLLAEFIKEINDKTKCDIEILANYELDLEVNSGPNIKHIRYIKNYDEFYAQGGLVVLLDTGGAGTTNRSLAACRHSLPFISTPAALRGHDYKFQNALGVTDDIKKLAQIALENLNNLVRIDSDDLKSYIDSFKAKNASKPLIGKMSEIMAFNKII